MAAKDCPVAGWYEQQRTSSTRFQSIEHRRNTEAPFFHEFLLLKLTNGAMCRVERIGDGSRAGAIRHIGCTAYDLIQWFIKSDYDQVSAKDPSTLLAEVDLCREFDILDVLAVCYSVQNSKECCVYTLQRYNCYFLCLTVLTVLTRRVENWETTISTDDWDSFVSSLLDRLSNLSLEDSKEYMVLRLCALLEPNDLQPGRFILEGLRVHLASQAGALNNYTRAMSSTLWETAREPALHDVLLTLLEPAVPASLDGGSHCKTQFRHALQISSRDSELAIQSDSVLAKHYSKAVSKQIDLLVDKVIEICKKLRQMRNVEHPIPFGERMSFRPSTPLSIRDPGAALVGAFADSRNKDDFRALFLLVFRNHAALSHDAGDFVEA
ncbi:hypothetical protein FRC10_010685 [Ceratobasidium sp. 414]|nr:hypothetical protein FRC10_010685 [Ceratobasidium sp. 414]